MCMMGCVKNVPACVTRKQHGKFQYPALLKPREEKLYPKRRVVYRVMQLNCRLTLTVEETFLVM
jgi:hypothetical protein